MRDELRIRDGTRADDPWILSLGERLFGDLGDYRLILGHWLDSPRTISLIAENGDNRCGFVLVAPRRSIGFLWRPWAELVGIGTIEEARRVGVGRCLLDAAVGVGVSWRAREMRLHTAIANETGQAFFQATGFQHRVSEAIFYPSGEPALEMVRPLRGTGSQEDATAPAAVNNSR